MANGALSSSCWAIGSSPLARNNSDVLAPKVSRFDQGVMPRTDEDDGECGGQRSGPLKLESRPVTRDPSSTEWTFPGESSPRGLTARAADRRFGRPWPG